jgi:hypothetical protein
VRPRCLRRSDRRMRPKLRQDTDATHVSRILTKLDLRDRAQAVVFAYEDRVVSAGTADR